ncbi:hypothetical protein [Roseibium sediminis]|uniref:hypothetical protein n=1 Tax=Roseibium sediminis TaxID=1775174 RepID=UPI00123E10C4|nr:hypothetical protein [Roseibium sediminis]
MKNINDLPKHSIAGEPDGIRTLDASLPASGEGLAVQRHVRSLGKAEIERCQCRCAGVVAVDGVQLAGCADQAEEEAARLLDLFLEDVRVSTGFSRSYV